jgi:uncharacterized protein YjbI with pentapeptide repeats
VNAKVWRRRGFLSGHGCQLPTATGLSPLSFGRVWSVLTRWWRWWRRLLRNFFTRLLPAVVITVLLGAALATALTLFLTWLVTGKLPAPGPNGTSPFLDVLKVALAVAAGIGGAVALVVAYRRQRHTEVDDVGRRSRYSSAAQQLGDPQPAVRLAGVYAMAHLADEWAEQRQQCVDVLCAYLRLPWAGDPTQVEPNTTTTEHTWPDGAGQRKVTKTYSGRAGEREVRQTLVRVIASHLRPDTGSITGSAISWSDLDIDLTNAALPDADFSNANFHGQASFRHAAFLGPSSFRRARFSGHASFVGARFSGGAIFEGARFSEAASFRGAQFSGMASFGRARFSGGAIFEVAQFSEAASFGEAQFYADAFFGGAQFSGPAAFGNARFSARSFFGGAQFSSAADFDDAQFSHLAFFRKTQFSGPASFGKAQFPLGATFEEAQFSRRVSFREAQFSSDADFDGVRFSGRAVFDGAQFSGGRALFEGAQFSSNAQFEGAQFADDANFADASLPSRSVFASAIVPPSDEALNAAMYLDELPASQQIPPSTS